jgi:two-component system, OmpR family, copper resistance phosphate regulon response regulator CusR
MKLLLVEDDPKAARSLQQGLREEGFVVDHAEDGHTGLEHAVSGGCDLVILDVSLPGMNGWTLLEQLRKGGHQTPVIMLTARDALDDRVKGLSLGADDYVVKPFAFSELIARIRAVLRRKDGPALARLSYEGLTLDLARGKVNRDGVEIELTQKEMQLLELFMRHKEEVLSRTYIAERVWEVTFDGDSNVVDVSVWRLRGKIDEPFERKLIHTVRGRGYVFR